MYIFQIKHIFKSRKINNFVSLLGNLLNNEQFENLISSIVLLYKYHKSVSMAKITVQKTEITIVTFEERDYISLTDMANAKESESRAADIIKIGYETDIHLSFLELGKWFIIQILKWSNLTTLNRKLDYRVLF